MGNWAIVITGHGANHNGKASDADIIATECVHELTDAGQELSSAQFLYGVPESLLPAPSAPDDWPTNDDK